MADPKYANLPGIDLTSPDTYETSDLPEDDQEQVTADEPLSDDIEKVNVNPAEAYSKFKGKSVDARFTDFSDAIGPSRKSGYDVPRTEYEMAGDGDMPETPQQKYQRLQHEIRQLAEEVSDIKEDIKADSVNEAVTPVAMAKQAEYLQQQLNDLHLDKVLGGNGAVNLADPQGALQKRLLMQLESFKAKPGEATKSSQKAVTTGSPDDPDHVTYQLYYRPEQAKFSNNAKMADLEQRLERLEALLGNNPEKVSYLTADTSSKTLLEAVALLSAKTKILDPTHIEHIEGRLQLLNQKLGQVAEKKTAVEQVEKQNKVAELYEIVKKWDSLANTLPHIVDRLVALKDLHQQALQFSQALKQLDSAQQQIQKHLVEHGDILKQVQGTLQDNMSSILAACKNLESRISAVKK